MKRLTLLILALMGLSLLAVAGGATFVALRGMPRYPRWDPGFDVRVTPERVARGRKTARMLCARCHYEPVTDSFRGNRVRYLPEEFGAVYGRNITKDWDRGISRWPDGELAFFLRTGLRPDGKYVFPYMVQLPRMADEDLYDLIAFLRSEDPWVRPIPIPDIHFEPNFLVKLLSRTRFEPNPYPQESIPLPDTKDKVAWGRYLAVDKLDCYGCHSRDFKTNDIQHPERSQGFFGGGNPLLDAQSQSRVYSTNLTPDPVHGIGQWTEAQFIRALKEGFRPDGTVLRYPMELYGDLTDEEAGAIYAYLRTVPPLATPRRKPEALAPAPAASRGAELYQKYFCHSCHGQTGVLLCDLRGTSGKYPTDEELAAFIRNPSRSIPGSKMPAWEGVIQEDEYAPLIQYVRSLGGKP